MSSLLRNSKVWLAGLLLAGMPLCSTAEMTWMPETFPTSERAQSAWERRTPFLESELEAAGMQLGAPIFIRIFKQSRELELFVDIGERFEKFRSYRICDMSGDIGPKLAEGDEQSPEGFYSVSAEWLNPRSQFHLSFNIGYPNDFDRARNRTGSLIMIHGGCASRGCFAMTDWRMEEIYILAEAALRGGQQAFDVHVFPFRMTDETLAEHRDSRWYYFWRTLKRGHDHFERHGRPPLVTMTNGLYAFNKPPAPESSRVARSRPPRSGAASGTAASGHD